MKKDASVQLSAWRVNYLSHLAKKHGIKYTTRLTKPGYRRFWRL